MHMNQKHIEVVRDIKNLRILVAYQTQAMGVPLIEVVEKYV